MRILCAQLFTNIPLHYHVFNLIVEDTKHSLIPIVCVLSGIFYFNLASVLDAFRSVMIKNTNSVPNLLHTFNGIVLR